MYTFVTRDVAKTGAQMFSFLYRVFYDRTLFGSFVKNGKGYGLKPLFVLTLFVAFCLSVRIFLIFSAVTPRLVDKIAEQLPEIVIEKGKIVSPKEYEYSYVFSNQNVFFVFDTTEEPLKLKNLPPNGIYITSDALVSVNADKIRRIPFVQLLNGKDLILNQTNMRQWGNEMVSLFRFMVPPLLFFFSIPGAFSLYFLVCVCYAVISYLMTHITGKNLSWDQRMRLAALSVMPVYILNAAGFLLGCSFQLGRIGIFITLIYMFCFLKDGDNAAPSAVR